MGGKYTIEYTGVVFKCFTTEIYVILLTNVTPINQSINKRHFVERDLKRGKDKVFL